MTKLAGVLCGGLKEAKSLIDAKIANLNQTRDSLRKVGFIAATLAVYYFIQWCIMRRNVWFRRGANMALEVKGEQMQASESCHMCTEHAADIVFVPCNHLLVCRACFRHMKN